VAVAAAKIVVLVNRAVPEDALSALMAGEALGVLLRDRCFAFVREADDGRKIAGILDVRRARPMATLAAFRFVRVSWIDGENRGVDRMRPVLRLLLMAGLAHLLTDIGAIVRHSGGRVRFGRAHNLKIDFGHNGAVICAMIGQVLRDREAIGVVEVHRVARCGALAVLYDAVQRRGVHDTAMYFPEFGACVT